jgi:hypothetical protein
MKPRADLQADADRLLKMLWDLNITNTEAIRECGCNQTTFYRWLAAKTPIPRSAMRMFELMLEVRKISVADTAAES